MGIEEEGWGLRRRDEDWEGEIRSEGKESAEDWEGGMMGEGMIEDWGKGMGKERRAEDWRGGWVTTNKVGKVKRIIIERQIFPLNLAKSVGFGIWENSHISLRRYIYVCTLHKWGYSPGLWQGLTITPSPPSPGGQSVAVRQFQPQGRAGWGEGGLRLPISLADDPQ